MAAAGMCLGWVWFLQQLLEPVFFAAAGMCLGWVRFLQQRLEPAIYAAAGMSSAWVQFVQQLLEAAIFGGAKSVFSVLVTNTVGTIVVLISRYVFGWIGERIREGQARIEQARNHQFPLVGVEVQL